MRFQDNSTLERTEQVGKQMLIELFRWNKSQIIDTPEGENVGDSPKVFFVENSYEETWIQAFNSIKKSLLKKKDENQISSLLRLIESNRKKSPEHQLLLSKVHLQSLKDCLHDEDD